MRAIFLGAALAVALLAPRAARACGAGGHGSGSYNLGLGMVVLLAPATLGLTVADGISALEGHPPRRIYGGLELLLAAPQLLLGIGELGHYWGSGGLSGGWQTGFFAGYTAWAVFLTSHAIWTLANPLETQQARVSLGPTYAPVGQQAKPGFGLVGRF